MSRLEMWCAFIRNIKFMCSLTKNIFNFCSRIAIVYAALTRGNTLVD